MSDFKNSEAPVEILLVEDNDDDILMIQKSFKDAKLANVINVVKDGEEAIKFLQRRDGYQDARRPGLVLLDINMPKKNGFEVLMEMKADANLRHIPVIMLTTSERDEDIVRSYEQGAASFISKPVSIEKFKEVVHHFSLYWALVAKLPSA